MTMRHNILLVVFLSLCSVVTSANASVDDLLRKMKEIQANPVKLEAAIAQGEERGRLCFSCHGRDGNSKREYIPNLASQNASYLFTQFEHFADGSRKDYVMSKLAKQLTEDERIAIALYFSDRRVMPRPKRIAASADGKRIYNTTCFACHGSSGHGNDQYPRIAGQPLEFLNNTLKSFKNNDPDRQNSPMVAVIKNLSQQDLDAVATYVTNLP